MENKERCPQLLDLIHKEWLKRGDDEERLGVAEEKKLQLRLAPPGEEDWFSNEHKGYNNGGNQNQRLGAIFSSSWGSKAIPTVYQMKTQQETKGVGELQQSQAEKKACSPPSATTVPANTTAVNNSSQKRSAPSPVVGWPPVRSFRKNLANSSSSKQALDSQNGSKEVNINTNTKTKQESSNKSMFVKINMDGVPIGRKVDLKAYDSYGKLSSAVDELFRGLLAAQRDSPVTGNLNKVDDVKQITGLLDGSGEYTLVYEDNEGDRMLVGDVPWDMFASTVKRLRVLKSSELSSLRVGCGKQGKLSL